MVTRSIWWNCALVPATNGVYDVTTKKMCTLLNCARGWREWMPFSLDFLENLVWTISSNRMNGVQLLHSLEFRQCVHVNGKCAVCSEQIYKYEMARYSPLNILCLCAPTLACGSVRVCVGMTYERVWPYVYFRFCKISLHNLYTYLPIVVLCMQIARHSNGPSQSNACVVFFAVLVVFRFRYRFSDNWRASRHRRCPCHLANLLFSIHLCTECWMR